MFAASSPRIEARFWVALCFASICGINLGDLLPDAFHLAAAPALAILIGVFAALALTQALIGRRAEVLFWLALLMVRAAATVLADFSISEAHLGFPAVSAALAILFLAGVAASRGFAGAEGLVFPGASPLSWLTLAIAAALGTVTADWAGHAMGSPKIGVPVAAVGETLLVGAALVARLRAGRPTWSYWLATLTIFTWGTSVGDIVKFLLSMPVCLGGSFVLLGLTILAWRPGGNRSAPRPGGRGGRPQGDSP